MEIKMKMHSRLMLGCFMEDIIGIIDRKGTGKAIKRHIGGLSQGTKK